MKPNRSHPHLPVLRSPEDNRPLGRRHLYEMRPNQHFITLATRARGQVIEKDKGHILVWVGSADRERKLSPFVCVEAL